jgi:3-hydroxyacyl-CoA dehydrogenase
MIALRVAVRDRIAFVTIDNPPVNALGQAVRAALVDAVTQLAGNDSVDAMVLACSGRTFIAGADIREFGVAAEPPHLPDVVNAIEASAKPVVAAIHGTALGGGLEVALGCHARVASPSAKLGLPEVTLGLMPGAGGTQRLPRLVGLDMALTMITFGKSVGAVEAEAAGLIDCIAPESRLLDTATEVVRRLIGQPLRRTRDLTDRITAATTDQVDNFAIANARKIRSLDAPAAILASLRDAITLPFADGMATERERFLALRAGAQSAALRHAFFAERQACKLSGLEGLEPRTIDSVGIVGAGTMGTGIALNFLLAGIPVRLIEQRDQALARGVAVIRKTLEDNAVSGRCSHAAAKRAGALLTFSLDYADLANADLIIEAAFETMEVKRAIFTDLDRVAKAGAILATNTSYLDVDAIAAVTTRPGDVIGLHFFSPANIMKLLEIVRARETAADVLVTGLALAKCIGKVAVVSGNAYGFIGNRMLAVRRREAEAMLVEGAPAETIDRVLETFGFPMGPFRMADLAGLDLGWFAGTSTGSSVRDRLNEAGRHGQKAGAGFYDYDDNRRPFSSARAEAIVARFAADMGITRRVFDDTEILDRLLWPMIDEGNRILEEGIALRASDIDAVWLNGYGWPRWTGGPMYYAHHTIRGRSHSDRAA